MENASNALIIAASVLLGVMIISVGVALFTSFADFSSDSYKQLEEKQISEWNNKYLQYYGDITTIDNRGREVKNPIIVTAHDIVSVANNARQNNNNYELDKTSSGNENLYYVQVCVKDDTKTYTNFESLEDSEKSKFLKDNSLIENDTLELVQKQYKCANVKISSITKRVYYIEFTNYD